MRILARGRIASMCYRPIRYPGPGPTKAGAQDGPGRQGFVEVPSPDTLPQGTLKKRAPSARKIRANIYRVRRPDYLINCADPAGSPYIYN